jgi:hypothetical protein
MLVILSGSYSIPSFFLTPTITAIKWINDFKYNYLYAKTVLDKIHTCIFFVNNNKKKHLHIRWPGSFDIWLFFAEW